VTTTVCFAVLCLRLYLERRSVLRNAARIPVRVAVTGTRGKSTVTRMIAAALREAGFSVLAKTTGSRAVIIRPDGREEEIARRGRPSILEQKGILREAAGLGVRAAVVELMSIRPEYLAVESGRILRPQYLVITNVRLDHREEMGQTKPEIARSLASAIRSGMTVFLPEGERHPELERAAERAGARIVLVEYPKDGSLFDEDKRLAEAVASHLGVSAAAALRGIAAAAPDFGSLKAWQAELGRSQATWTLVSAFAANEPESSRLILAHLRGKHIPDGRPLIGLLNFRADRGDRTRQWLEAHREGFFSGFRSLYGTGAHIHSLRIRNKTRRPPRLIPIPDRLPSSVMEKIAAAENGGGVVIGLGNIGGMGEALVEYWQKIGRPYAL
jgi:poly-gamma-glutamate synthase PgsB/CapB